MVRRPREILTQVVDAGEPLSGSGLRIGFPQVESSDRCSEESLQVGFGAAVVQGFDTIVVTRQGQPAEGPLKYLSAIAWTCIAKLDIVAVANGRLVLEVARQYLREAESE